MPESGRRCRQREIISAEPSRAQRLGGVFHKMSGPQACPTGQFQAVAKGRTGGEGPLHLSQLGKPLGSGILAPIVAALPETPLVILP